MQKAKKPKLIQNYLAKKENMTRRKNDELGETNISMPPPPSYKGTEGESESEPEHLEPGIFAYNQDIPTKKGLRALAYLNKEKNHPQDVNAVEYFSVYLQRDIDLL